jgi:ketosteroid isomerase-like protein
VRPLVAGRLAVLAALLLAPGGIPAQESMPAAAGPPREVVASYEAALAALLDGRAGPWLRLLSAAPDVTLLGPAGSVTRGQEAVRRAIAADAARFDASGAQPVIEYVGSLVGQDVAVTVGVERTARVRGRGERTERAGYARVTNVLRREDGAWRLVHSHRDSLAEAQPMPGPAGGATGPSEATAPPGGGAVPPPSGTTLVALKATYEAALAGMLRGDEAPWQRMVTARPDVTLLNPFGLVRHGQADVRGMYARAAARLEPADVRLEIEYLAAAVVADIGYVVAIERSDGFRFRGDTIPRRNGVTRATNVFRLEQGAWRLVHRHMDHLRERVDEVGS